MGRPLRRRAATARSGLLAPPGTRAELAEVRRRDLHALAERVARIEGALTGPWRPTNGSPAPASKTPPDARSAGTAGRGGVPERLSGNLTYPGESPPRSALLRPEPSRRSRNGDILVDEATDSMNGEQPDQKRGPGGGHDRCRHGRPQSSGSWRGCW